MRSIGRLGQAGAHPLPSPRLAWRVLSGDVVTLLRSTSKDSDSVSSEGAVSRFRAPTWRNGRFLAGAALLVACTLVGAVLLATPPTTKVWATTHDLPAGAVLRSADLAALSVSVPPGYALASQPIVGQRLRRSLGAHELVPAASLGATVAGDFRSIALPIEADHSPPSLVAGNYVDVWVTPRDVTGAFGVPFLALAAAPVSSVTRDSMSGPTGAATVVLDVKPSQARTLIDGLRTGVIDLVRVPGASQ